MKHNKHPYHPGLAAPTRTTLRHENVPMDGSRKIVPPKPKKRPKRVQGK